MLLAMAGNKISKLLSADTPFFTMSSLQAIFGVTRESTRTIAARFVKRGVPVVTLEPSFLMTEKLLTFLDRQAGRDILMRGSF